MEALAEAGAFLQKCGVDGAALDAQVLLAHCTGLDRAGLYREGQRELTREQADNFRALVRRRAAREPVAYLTGHREFMGLDFLVRPGVLIPRPETELLVEEALAQPAKRRNGGTFPGGADAPGIAGGGHARRGGPAGALRIADAGTGSGAIAVSLARFLPAALVYATDISPAALDTARQNAFRHGVAERISFFSGDLLVPLLERGLAGRLDLVAANLPYVPSAGLPGLMPDVRLYEPSTALDGGPDGLDLYRRLIPQAKELLAPGGHLLIEIDPSQAPLIPALLDRRDWVYAVRRDLAGRERLVAAWRNGIKSINDQSENHLP
ncbi:protein-(glutamine-N5) methyltransferase, release factor-specific [Desulfotomaculum copahuensis]|uniref:Release factor glutamine methyltransferase n=2 Tax=Desulfotomaculum copahuensis TaxID=1838280 RepID=A0A1B7LB62_9FIRM|nr:protein-(glutamine-N5) methyltransferase, release factor-specific [Desulfotomaculum copahuensis]